MCACALTRAEFSENDKLGIAVASVGGRGASSPHQLDDVGVASQLFLQREREREREEREREERGE